MWGLDLNGNFITDESITIQANFFQKMIETMSSDKIVDVRTLIFQDLKNVKKSIDVEAALLRIKKASHREIGRKLLFIFQCDLLPGISGKILELKGSRDNPNVLQKSKMIKLIGWTILLVLNLFMLFYILLFAFSQTGPRQSAWFKSFAIWLAMEIIIVSTSIVIISHIFIPIAIMKDLTKIKKKLIENVREYQDTIKRNKKNGIDINDQENIERLNAAKYLFISSGLSKLFPDVKESKIIAQFSTPWPKQSYCRVKDVSKQYSKKSSALTRSASILIIFFVGQFLNMPSGFQDVIINVSSTAAMGYVILVHIQLYQLFPALVILPLCIIGIIVHFIITSGKADAKLRLAKLFPVRTNDVKDCVVYDHRQALTNNYPSSSEVNVHQTRRASLQLGLNVIDEIQQIESSGSEESFSDSDDNDHEGSDDDYDDEDDGSDDDDADNNHEGSVDVDDYDDSADESESSVYNDYRSNVDNETNDNGSHINTSTYDSVSFDMEDYNASDGNDKSVFNNNENGNNSNNNIQDVTYIRNTNSIDDSLQNDLNSENSSVSVDSTCYDSVSEQSSITIEKLEVDAI